MFVDQKVGIYSAVLQWCIYKSDDWRWQDIIRKTDNIVEHLFVFQIQMSTGNNWKNSDGELLILWASEIFESSSYSITVFLWQGIVETSCKIWCLFTYGCYSGYYGLTSVSHTIYLWRPVTLSSLTLPHIEFLLFFFLLKLCSTSQLCTLSLFKHECACTQFLFLISPCHLSLWIPYF